MALEGLLAKLGPTVVREVTPHLLQLVSGFTERFRSDTREMKAAVDAEVASLSRTQAGLVTSVDQQRERTEALQSHMVALERKIDRLQESVDTMVRHATGSAASAGAAQQLTKSMAVAAALFSLLACVLSAVLLLHR